MSKSKDSMNMFTGQMSVAASRNGINFKFFVRNIVRDYGIYIALGGVVVFFSILIPHFRTLQNVILILLQVSVTGIISIGMLFVILSAGIDLSVGAILAVAGMISGVYAQMEPTAISVILALGFPLVIGLFCGIFNGFVISYLGVAPLIVTLGTMYAYRGYVVWYRVNPIYNLSSWYRVIGQHTIGPIPIPVIILLIIAGLASVVLHFTRFGRYVYAIGGNRQAARAAGINVKLVELGVYVISGFCCGLAGLVFTSRLGAAQAISGLGFELTCIASVVVGGASLFGGRGTVGQTMVGALIIGVLSNGLVMLNVPSPIQQMIIGMIIIAAVWVDSILRKRA
jgi:ribose/xylose/arabinose/galactoside ABC-type transport system permease subunit